MGTKLKPKIHNPLGENQVYSEGINVEQEEAKSIP